MITSLSLGIVHLNGKDIVLLRDFYHEIIGLDILHEDSETVLLGTKEKTLLTLSSTSHLPINHSHQAGLYHFAIVYSSRGDLARTVHRILIKSPESFVGSADHLVSEAFYFSDPEGNGIELYYDKDRSLWQWENNQVKMASLYIDPVEYIKTYIVLEEKKSHQDMGHIHLRVGDIRTAKQFYKDILGFDVTAQVPGALFVSVGGYHHHIGMNTWESEGVGERVESLGLKHFEMIFSKEHDFISLKNRLKENNVTVFPVDNSFSFHDPWKNKITIILV